MKIRRTFDDVTVAIVASGLSYPDALADNAETLATIHVYGGPNAVTDSTVNAAEVAAGRSNP